MKRKTLLICLLFAGISTVQADSPVLVFQSPDRNPVSTPLPVEVLRASVPVPEPAATSPAITPARAAPVRRGPLVTIPPTLPDAKATAQARTDFPEVWNGLDAMAKTQVNEDTPGLVDCQVENPDVGIIDQRLHPCTSYLGNQQLAQVLRYPWRTIGKLFMHMDGGWYEGTAQIVSTTGKQTLVVTAAHNIWSAKSKKPADQIIFVPAYRDGVAAYGQFEFDQAFVLKGWVDDTDNQPGRYDVALLTLKPNSAKREAASYTGTLGLRWNVPYVMSINQFGYSEIPQEGEFTTISTGQTFRKVWGENNKNCSPNPTDEVLFIGSPLVAGASGGAWIESFRPYYDKNGNYVVSVEHGGVMCVKGTPILIHSISTGAQFSDDNIGALCAKAGCSNPAIPKR